MSVFLTTFSFFITTVITLTPGTDFTRILILRVPEHINLAWIASEAYIGQSTFLIFYRRRLYTLTPISVSVHCPYYLKLFQSTLFIFSTKTTNTNLQVYL